MYIYQINFVDSVKLMRKYMDKYMDEYMDRKNRESNKENKKDKSKYKKYIYFCIERSKYIHIKERNVHTIL